MDKNQDLLFCDLETTGGDSKIDRIMEIGLVHVRNGKVIERYQQLVNPERNISWFITKITGIDDSMVQNQPIFVDIAAEIFGRVQGKIFVAHSANFDYRFLQREFAMAGYEFETQPICTVKLSRALYPEYRKHNLDALIDRFDLTCSGRHRALGDAAVLWDLWQIFEPTHGAKFFAALDKQVQKQKLELNICTSVLDSLSDSAGVYVFSDNEQPLYVGYGKNIQQCVKSHFSGDNIKKRDKKLAAEMMKVSTVEAIGPVSARLQFIEYKKKYRPRYNRKCDTAVVHWSFRLKKDGLGYFQPQFFSFIPEEEGVELGSYGLFLTRERAVKRLKILLAATQLLERKNLISSLLYNVRFELALSALKHHEWPHESVWTLVELGKNRHQKQVHVFDTWCYLGSAESEADVSDLILEAERRFCPYLYPVIQSLV